MNSLFNNPEAFKPFSEPVKWVADAAPHKSGTFTAVVNRGAVDSSSAGASIATVVGDVWSVHADRKTAICAGVKIGDTIHRIGIDGEVLTVQQIIRDDGGWWFICTSNEKVPH